MVRIKWNFYRIHLTFFTLHPLIWSAIFWGANGEFPVSYVDALFLCFSAQTVTGLSTVNLSTVTGFQQFILFWLMVTGNYTAVSWVMVMVRRHYFIKKCAHVIRKKRLDQQQQGRVGIALDRLRSYTIDALNWGQVLPNAPAHASPMQEKTDQALPNANATEDSDKTRYETRSPSSRSSRVHVVGPSHAATLDVRPDEDESGDPLPSATPSSLDLGGAPLQRTSSPASISTDGGPPSEHAHVPSPLAHEVERDTKPTEPVLSPRTVGFAPAQAPSTPVFPRNATNRSTPVTPHTTGIGLPRSGTNRSATVTPYTTGIGLPRTGTNRSGTGAYVSTGLGFPRTTTNATARTGRSVRTGTVSLAPSGAGSGVLAPREHTDEDNFGGFPTPLTLGARALRHIAPGTFERLERGLTMVSEEQLRPMKRRTTASGSTNGSGSGTGEAHVQNGVVGEQEGRGEARRAGSNDWTDDLEALHTKMKSYIKSGALWVGRNSFFHLEDLDDDELEQVGGVEFAALRILAWLVPLYFVFTQMCTFIIYTAYLQHVHRFDPVFQAQPRFIPTPWFSAFQAVSAYTGGGLSLVDEGMVPFIDAFPLVISLGALICAGNMLLPVFLRCSVWLIYHALPKRSHSRPYFQFLLDHPRRCFLYMFPSHQTWFLVAVFFFLTAIEWGGFFVFNIGLEAIDSIPQGQRVLAGLFQSFGVRASGFSIVGLQALAPACKFLYIVMMYISAYPIAMALRATNVYEERSLGVYNANEQAEDEAPQGEVFSKYLGWHIRRQLSFDLWWLVAALLAIDIIERDKLLNDANAWWFSQFTILFEVVSAYATTGLSLGIPTQNYSFSGALRPGSKIILILVMLRGRHRDLPVAIDRAILLPEEFSKATPDPKGRHVVQENVARELEMEADMLTPVTEHHHTVFM